MSDKAVKGSPCALCAKMRKGALNEAAQELGCNKVAYAHHMDDVIETAFLSMIFEGRFYAFPPSTHLDRTQLVVIRPLLYVSEAEVKGFRIKASESGKRVEESERVLATGNADCNVIALLDEFIIVNRLARIA